MQKLISTENFQLHDYLSDQADWNAKSWALDLARIDNYCNRLEALYNHTKQGFTFQALWAGEKPKETQEITIGKLLELLRTNGISTSSKYTWSPNMHNKPVRVTKICCHAFC